MDEDGAQMKYWGVVSLLWMLLPLGAHAQIGSPNIFFDGQAGPYSVRAIIRPPAALPGLAQVDVHVNGVTNVLLQTALFESASEAAPPPVSAVPVAGETNLFNGTVWLLRPGSYSMRVTLNGVHGPGSVVVP